MNYKYRSISARTGLRWIFHQQQPPPLPSSLNSLINMYIRASQRGRLTQSIFTSTFAICFLLVGANQIVPCPVDSVHGNDSVVDERMKKAQMAKKEKETQS